VDPRLASVERWNEAAHYNGKFPYGAKGLAAAAKAWRQWLALVAGGERTADWHKG